MNNILDKLPEVAQEYLKVLDASRQIMTVESAKNQYKEIMRGYIICLKDFGVLNRDEMHELIVHFCKE